MPTATMEDVQARLPQILEELAPRGGGRHHPRGQTGCPIDGFE